MHQGGSSVHGPSEPGATDSPRFRARQERAARAQERGARPGRLGRRATVLLLVALAGVSAWVLTAAFAGGGAGRQARDLLVGTSVVIAVLGGGVLGTLALVGLLWCVFTLGAAVVRRIPGARRLEAQPLQVAGRHPFEPNVFGPRFRALAQFSSPPLAVVAVLAACWLPRPGDTGDIAAAVFLCALPSLVVATAAGWRQRLQVDRAGVRVVSMVRQVSIPWSWITDVTVKKITHEGSTSYELILITDRDHLPIKTPSSADRGEMEALRAFLLRGRDLARADQDRPPQADPPAQPAYGTPEVGAPLYGTPHHGTPEPRTPSSTPQSEAVVAGGPQPSTSGSARGPLLAGVGVALLMLGAVELALTLTGDGASGAQAIGSAPAEALPSPSARVDLFDLRTGDCVLYRGGPEVLADIGVVPCTQRHDAEMSGSVTLPDAPWPGESTLRRRSDDACLSIFESYIGIPFRESHLSFASIPPTQEAWESGDRSVICLVTLASGAVATPMAGSRA